ncbi:MAG TPA: PQQ-binding-like beta-propeller repeat protein [Vicinamibacterales bacterium]|nr:PQQ-binding-like beta-propeller repeat protein [Vicinamibacterales bacterium]
MKRTILTAVMVAWAAGASAGQAPPARAAGPGSTPPPNGGNRGFVPVTDEMLWKPSPSNWLSWRRTLDSQGFSPLDQIDRTNVGRLKMVWARGMGAGNMESTPLVYDGVMYAPGPADYIQAINAKTGDLIWESRRKLPEGVRGGTNRNIAIWGTTIIDASADNQMYAIDAITGAPVWETKVLEATARASASSGPIIANGKVIEGRQCQPQAGNDACVVTAHDAKTGKELWRTRTIPLPGEFGYDTWGDVPMAERWHVGTWMVPSYDPETNTIFVGTSVTIPAPKFTLAGNDKKYLFHNSTLAIDADTGKIKWHYQHVVDHWDLDHPFERLLVETAVSPDPKEVPWINPKIKPGERRKVMTGIPGKTGLVYTLDRQTGEFLWARPTVFQNVITKIDGATGEVTVNPEKLFTKIDEEKLICPSSNGGKNWPAGAYNPRSNVMFMPLQNMCMKAKTTTDTRDPSKVYGLNMPGELAPNTDKVGVVWAISAETGRTVWKHEQRAGVMSLVATGGGLVFGGDVNGRFRAFDDKTGKILWEQNLGAPVSGFPVTFAVDGKQYVAVTTGPSLVANSALRLTPELKPSNTGQLYVFALP